MVATSNLNYRSSSAARINPKRLIQPLFIVPGSGVRKAAPSPPGTVLLSIDSAADEAARLEQLGIGGIIPYSIQSSRDSEASAALERHGALDSAISALKRRAPSLYVIADLCLCHFTDHGHCGLLRDQEIDNDRTLEVLGTMAHSLAGAGADAVMPSGMIDGAVRTARRALDQGGFSTVAVISQAAKMDSGMYGPFRRASGTDGVIGSKSSYQIAPANRRESLRELSSDEAEGADMIVLKPSLGYGDLISEFHQKTALPLIAYCTSGEHAMLHTRRLESEEAYRAGMLEYFTGLLACGASMIVTYAASELVVP